MVQSITCEESKHYVPYVNISFSIPFAGKFFHVTDIVNDFGTACFIHGVIVACTVTIIAVILLGTFIYLVCKYDLFLFMLVLIDVSLCNTLQYYLFSLVTFSTCIIFLSFLFLGSSFLSFI